MPQRSYIEAMDRPTVLYILYTMVSAQQTNLLPKNASRNDAIFAQKVYRTIGDHFAILKFLWLRNHHGLYIYIARLYSRASCYGNRYRYGVQYIGGVACFPTQGYPQYRILSLAISDYRRPLRNT